ncbi:gliding motility-associated C-terminal domain-containing protein [Mucilaginibacter sp.]|uniref:Ig-like domain-containing protein n=1 Tax=Mucilaginibacter sp. TaxID=1882438 RepID=UPI0025E213D9|nr:gliding motility-associated C-terminal domain-containing protein [Mucilaginibacter sp.]
MNNKSNFNNACSKANIKYSLRYLLLPALFILAHCYCNAQSFKPNWVNDLRGASVYCVVTDLTVDKQNNVYVTGWFQGTYDFDPSAGVKNLTSVGQYDTFIAKYKQDGTLVWVKSIGGSGVDQPNSIAIDKNGNISITGSSYSATLDADPGPGVYMLTKPSEDPQTSFGFLIHLGNNGEFLWAQSGVERFARAASDSQGNVIATSFFNSPVTIGDSTYTPSPVGYSSLIVKYGPGGNVLWDISLTARNGVTLILDGKVDKLDNIIITGDFTDEVNFNPLGVSHSLVPDNANAEFVAKYTPSGVLIWVNGINQVSAINVGSTSIGVDQQNNIYFNAPFYNLIVFGTDTLKANGIDDNICIAKYSPAGVLQFAKSIGGTDYIDYGSKFAFDKNNNIYLSGYFKGTVNFNTNASNAKNVSSHGPLDFYLAEYDPNGNYVYAFSGGSTGCQSYSQAIAVDSDNNVNIGGAFCSAVNFDPSGCSPQSLTAASGSDGFIAQYASTAIANNVITAPRVTSFCGSGTPATITGSTPTGGAGVFTYQWQNSADSLNYSDIPGANSISYTPPVLNASTFYRRIVSNCSLSLTSNVVAVYVGPPPTAPQVAGDTICAGATITLAVTSPQPGLTYKWYDAAAGGTLLLTGLSFTTPALSTSNTYFAEADNGGCNSVRTAVTVAILQPFAAPVVIVGPVTATSITFEWTAVPGATGYQVSIDSGKTFSAPSSGANGLTTTISGLQPGNSITMIVQATGNQPCQLSAASAAVTAAVPNSKLIYVPNAFTPDRGGENDIAHVHSEGIQSMIFSIYDQWGELVFTSTNLKNGWDGTYKGRKEPAGAYLYYVHATMIDGKQLTKKGTITLIR